MEIAIRIPVEITQGTYSGNPLDVSTESAYRILKGITVGDQPVILRVISLGILLVFPPKISPRISLVTALKNLGGFPGILLRTYLQRFFQGFLDYFFLRELCLLL